jgi:hypothetical protein
MILWPVLLVREVRHCGPFISRRSQEIPFGRLKVALLGLFAGIPPQTFLKLELYRQRKGLSLHDFVLQSEFSGFAAGTRGAVDSVVLNDKVLFFETMLGEGIPTPPVVAKRTAAGFEVDPEFHHYMSWFAKPAGGHGGRGCTKIEKGDDGCYFLRGFTSSVGSETDSRPSARRFSLEELFAFLQTDRFSKDLIVQPCLENEAFLQKIAPSGLSVIRMVTGRTSTGVSAVAACYCMPAGHRIASQFGVFAQVSLEDGSLSCAADYSMSGDRRAKHPDSLIMVQGQIIPNWNACIDLAIRAHGLFPETSLVGWDIAPTAAGHVLLEGNLNFDVQMLQKWPSPPLLKTAMAEVLNEVVFERIN